MYAQRGIPVVLSSAATFRSGGIKLPAPQLCESQCHDHMGMQYLWTGADRGPLPRGSGRTPDDR